MPENVALALAMHALQQGDASFAATILIGYYAFLRTGEVLKLKNGQCNVDRAGNIILALGMSKSGKRRGELEYGLVEAGPVAVLVQCFLATRRPSDNVADSDEWIWRSKFDRYLHELGLTELGLRPYSLRRGGATHAFVLGETLTKVCVRGRWAQEATARIYIQEAVQLLQAFAIPAGCLARVNALAAAWNFPSG